MASKRMAKYQQTRKGRRPIRVHTLLKKEKTGAVEEPIMENDPLIQYLKTAAAETKSKGLVDSKGLLDDNEENQPAGKAEADLTSEDPSPPARVESNSGRDTETFLSDQFDNKIGKKKYLDKDFKPSSAAQSVVKKALSI